MSDPGSGQGSQGGRGGKLRVGIVGASGYTGGEALRLLLTHPRVEVALATSNSFVGKPVTRTHPNLRGLTDLKYAPHSAADAAGLDALFTAVPHGQAMGRMEAWLKGGAERVFDLSADFRLRDPAAYPTWYGHEHASPALLREAAYGIAELHRTEYPGTRLVSGAGCIATTAILALKPLFAEGVAEADVVVDAKIGSSAAGREPSAAGHHPERVGIVRAYAPTGHRHTAEIEQETGARVSLSCHAVELVRGILATCHVTLNQDLDEKALWRIYRQHYGPEPFVRIVKEKSGVYRYPEPKLLAGTNYCDVGFELDNRDGGRRVVVMAALDNLVKGAAGAAVQNMNVAYGWPETTGLTFPGLHP